MTVSATTSRADYTGNGATLAFTIPFYFLDNTHVKIIRTTISTGVPTTLALTTDYTLSGAGSGSGGTATMVVAPTTDQRIAILRNVPFTQLIHYVPNDPFPAATHEQALDQLTMEVQQMNETVGRALTLDASVVNASGALPAPTANAFIGWNANATGFQNYAGISNVTVSSAMQPVVQAVNISTARTLLNAAVSGANNDITSMGNVTVPTQTAGNSSGLIASTEFTATAITNAVKQIQNISAVATSNTMVVSLLPATFNFRSNTLSNGTLSTVVLNSTSNLTIPQGATLGAANANLTRIAVGGAVNNGTIVPIVGGTNVNLDESVLINVTNISNAANSSNVFYSNVNLTSVPWRSVGFIDSNQSMAGTYATQPIEVQGVGGNVLIGLARQFISAPVATTSGTSVSLTGIPAHTKTFTVNLNGVSTSGTSSLRIQIGAGSAETSGYLGKAAQQLMALERELARHFRQASIF
jgi:hypothetical protein